ncbi:hypothetical protein [Deinococcus altitudinis]|uniref:hypothetical protein n=1 Tax=Deinococcus altitudinis TaxID=468914 RepID=UPI0038914AE0
MLTLFTVCALLGGTLLALALLVRNVAWARKAELQGAGLQTLPRKALIFKATNSTEVRSLPGTGRARSVLLGLVSFAAFFGLGGCLASWLGLHPTFQWTFAFLSGLAVGGFTAFALSLAHMSLGQLSLGQLSLGQVRVEPFQGALERPRHSQVERPDETLSATGSRREQVDSGLE